MHVFKIIINSIWESSTGFILLQGSEREAALNPNVRDNTRETIRGVEYTYLSII